MNGLASQEFDALRQTIRSRGTARPIMFLVGLATWATTLLAILLLLQNPIASVVPLLVLLATFETVRSLHLGVERIGRYVQVFFEEGVSNQAPVAAPAWEHTAMIFGPGAPGAGVHPFFQPVFMLATLANLLAVLLPAPLLVEMATLLVPHVAFLVWIIHCNRRMRQQRAAELARFRQIRSALAQ